MTIGLLTFYSAQARLALLTCTLLLQLLVSAHHSQHSHPLPSSREQIQADYLQWVARVGHKQIAKVKSSHSEGHTSTIDVLWPAGQDQVEYSESDAAARFITVSKRGTGDFKSVQAAVNSIKSGNQQRVIIQIEAGVYEEKVKIPRKKPYITLQGAAGGGGQTVITWHDNARSAGSTFKSATFSVMSDGFIARDVTFSNTAPYPKPGARDMQAVAFQISGDKAALYNCRFLGTQDTLYDHKGRHYFRNCFIQGSVDFIFGGGLSLYENCELRAIAKAYGSFTAQKRKSVQEDSGFSFVHCKLTGSGVLYLGRAWGPYSRVVFVSSFIDAQIVPEGWYNWGDPARERMIKERLPRIHHSDVFILDSQISCKLDARDAPDNLVAWFTFCEPHARIIVFPYNSENHWSLVVIDMVEKIVLYCNSMARTTHVEIKNRVNILLATIENFHNSKVFKEMKHKNVQIPKQDLGHTCGWYVLYSACAILDKVYNEGKSKMPMDMYSTLDLLLFRIGVVEDILDHMTLTVPKAVEEDETKDDFVMMDRSDLTEKAEDEEEGK